MRDGITGNTKVSVFIRTKGAGSVRYLKERGGYSLNDEGCVHCECGKEKFEVVGGREVPRYYESLVHSMDRLACQDKIKDMF